MIVALDGVDGAGKTVQVRELHSRACNSGYRVISEKEPTNGPIGRLIKEVMGHQVNLCEPGLAALFAADRLDHIYRPGGLLENLSKYDLIICDRFYLSSYGYFSLTLSIERILDQNRWASSVVRPDLSIFLDTPIVECRSRLHARNQARDLYERDTDLEVVRTGFLYAISQIRDFPIIVVDGRGSVPEITDRIWTHVEPLLITP